ncbi:unnamed protein product [Schistocephalus solidus]|uniref:Secreted protein n=1 Tax=Schistocephalus solidus TaxID=70667 RepID=A0A183SSY8_SCHSO|nr:unnamed protein product [Schistocephalus solidus]
MTRHFAVTLCWREGRGLTELIFLPIFACFCSGTLVQVLHALNSAGPPAEPHLMHKSWFKKLRDYGRCVLIPGSEHLPDHAIIPLAMNFSINEDIICIRPVSSMWLRTPNSLQLTSSANLANDEIETECGIE